MPIAINGSGTVTGINAGGLPDATITTAEIVDANVTPAKLSQPLTLETAKASTSGTSVEFTGIPSWVKRITVMLNGVSTNGTNTILLQIGSGSYTTSGYGSYIGAITSASAANYGTNTNGFFIGSVAASTDTLSGVLTLVNITGNTWGFTGTAISIRTTNVVYYHTAVPIALSGALDRVRIIGGTAGTPTDTFDAGTINILYEG